MEIKMGLVDFLAGDIGLSVDDSWVAKTILWFQSVWTKKAKMAHAYAFISDDTVVEAVSKIKINPMDKYEGSTTDVYRIPIVDKERHDFKEGMLKRRNGAYGYLKYPLFVLDSFSTYVTGLFGKKEPIFFFTRHFGISNIPVCSQLVVWGIHKYTSYRFKDEKGREVNWRIVSPDYLEDLLKLPINRAELVYSFSNVSSKYVLTDA